MIDWLPLARALDASGPSWRPGAVAGDFEVRDASSRNDNAVVTLEGVGKWFVKREVPATEVAVYGRLADLPGFAPYLSPDVRVDAPTRQLWIPVEDGAEDLWRVHRRAGARVSPHLGGQVGHALGLLHRLTRTTAAGPRPDEAPPLLRLHRPRISELATLTPAGRDLVTAIQRHPGIGERLDELRAAWIPRALIHGDVKWPNILMVRPPGRTASIRLVDWEQAREGDPAWDIGAALGDWVCFWLFSIPGPAAARMSGVTPSARSPLSQMRPAIRACWDAYRGAAGLDSHGAAEARRRAVAFCAVRLLRTASEEADARHELTWRAALHLQVAANILADPDAASQRLLGLG